MASASSLATNDFLVSVVGNYTLDALLDSEQRRQHKELCAERLAAQDNVEVQYAEQAVLANLDWGIDALEEAILTCNEETRKARLEHAERMLQVSALLDTRYTTAGVPNSYLSAWAHLNLAFVWKLRGDDHNAAAHMLEMFLVEPLYSRVDFAPHLWEHLFLPHLPSIVAWYTEQRHTIIASIGPSGAEFSLSKEELSYNAAEYKNFLSTLSPEQASQLQQLEQLYQDSLDENTRLYARYYKEWLNFDPSVTPKRSMPLMPIAEPPMTPTHELSSNIPCSVKFGLQPPTSAGFSHSNLGFPTVFTSTSLQDTIPDVYCSMMGTHNPIWDQNEESEEHEHSPYGSTYGMDIQKGVKHTSYDEWFPQKSMMIGKCLDENKSNQKSNPDSQRSEFIKQLSPGKFQSLDKNDVNHSVRHREAPHRRTRSSRALSVLFKDQDGGTVSPSQSSPAIEQYSNCCEATLEDGQGAPPDDGDLAVTVASSTQMHYLSKKTMTVKTRRDSKEDTLTEQNQFQTEADKGKAHGNVQTQRRTSSPSLGLQAATERQSLSQLKLPDISTAVMRPPKDFVCPITSQIFNDPVTIETGQTYERRAIQEWIDRGNTTCPITRQTLQSLSLPKTNYVLKRVIASWKERHPDLALEYGSLENSPCLPRAQQLAPLPQNESMPVTSGSPVGNVSPISPSSSASSRKGGQSQRTNGRGTARHVSPKRDTTQGVLERLLDELKPAVVCICTSDELHECESAVLKVVQVWKESKGVQSIHGQLVHAEIIKGLMEVLSISNNSQVLEGALFILSELNERDASMAQMIAAEDPEYGFVVGLLKRKVMNSIVLLFQLKPVLSESAFADLLPSMIGVLHKCGNEYAACQNPCPMFMGQKEAALLMIDQMLTAADQNSRSNFARSIISMEGLSPLVDSLEATSLKERTSAVFILLCCMQTDGISRSYIAHSAQLSPVLELLHSGSDRGRNVTILFLSELVRLSRSINNQLLQVIKDEGSLSTMHVLLVHLQKVPHEQRPTIAGLLLQLDLLVKPRKGSMYREEAIEALIGALSSKDMLGSQVAAAETLVCLGSRFSPSGKPLLELSLLKAVGLEKGHKSVMMEEHLPQSERDISENREEEDRACAEWEKRVAGALVNFENGLIFESLSKGMKSQNLALSNPCTIVITWLVHILPSLPDTGIQEKACKVFMPEFIRILKSSKEMEDKALAILALHSFLDDCEGHQELVQHAKDISGPLRQLRRSLGMASTILKKLISSPHVNMPEIWAHEDIAPPTDATANGEVRCLVQFGGRLFSGHSDGTLKVWDCKKKNLILVRELKQHQKSIMCLHIPNAGDKLYSGSLDKTIKVWSIGLDEVQFMRSHDTKEPVQYLNVNSSMMCFGAPQNTGIRVLQGDAGMKTFLSNKHVQSIAMADGKIWCGCTDSSIQEVDLSRGSPIVVQQGVRTLLGKKATYGLQVHNDKLYSAGACVDGIAAKVWNLKDRSLAGQLTTSMDVRVVMVNDEFIYLGSNNGIIEVWLRERLVKVAGMSIGCKVTTLLAHDNVLYCGSEDGRIRRWVVG